MHHEGAKPSLLFLAFAVRALKLTQTQLITVSGMDQSTLTDESIFFAFVHSIKLFQPLALYCNISMEATQILIF